MALLNKEISNEDERELGPLKYLATITGWSMDKVVNWFLLLIVFVFDPLAIALVVTSNFAFAQIRKPKETVIEEYVDDDWFDEEGEPKEKYYSEAEAADYYTGPEPKEITLDGGEIEVTVEPTKEQMEELEAHEKKIDSVEETPTKTTTTSITDDLYGEDDAKNNERFKKFLANMKNVDSSTKDKIREGLNIWKGKNNL